MTPKSGRPSSTGANERAVSKRVSSAACTAASVPEPTGKQPEARRIIPIALLLLATGAFFGLGLDQYLSLDTLRENRVDFLAFVDHHRFLAILLYVVSYAVAVTLSVPVGALMTAAGGFLFGAMLGTAFAVSAATLGATAVFLVARSALGGIIRRKGGPFVRRLEAGFQENAFAYLLTLRLVPACPFWAANLVPAILDVRLSTYVVATGIGIIPGSFVYATFGAGLGRLFDADGTVDLRSIFTPEIIAGLVVLAALVLLSVVVRRRWAHSRR